MDATTAALISGVFTFLCTLLGVYHRDILDILRRSKRNLNGVWSGSARDVAIPGLLQYQQSLEYDLKAEIKQYGKRLTFRAKSESDRTSIIRGWGYLRGDYALVHYKNMTEHTDDQGVGLFYFLRSGNELKGFMLGKRMRETGMVLVYAEFTRSL